MSIKNINKISLNIFSHKYLKQGNLQLKEEEKNRATVQRSRNHQRNITLILKIKCIFFFKRNMFQFDEYVKIYKCNVSLRRIIRKTIPLRIPVFFLLTVIHILLIWCMGHIHNTQSSIKHNSFHLKDIGTQFFTMVFFFSKRGKILLANFVYGAVEWKFKKCNFF